MLHAHWPRFSFTELAHNRRMKLTWAVLMVHPSWSCNWTKVPVAWVCWMQENGVLCLPVWDKIHRCQRDLKGSGPEFLHFAQLATMYLWSTNYKPYKSQGFFEEKKELLQSFLSIESKARSVAQM